MSLKKPGTEIANWGELHIKRTWKPKASKLGRSKQKAELFKKKTYMEFL